MMWCIIILHDGESVLEAFDSVLKIQYQKQEKKKKKMQEILLERLTQQSKQGKMA